MKNKFYIVLVMFAIFFIGAGMAFALSAPAPDTIRISTTARPLGMGKAFVGLADDIGSIFLNPAGIANPTRWQLTSMSGRMLDEFNYFSFSGIYPTNFGNLGLSYTASSINGALPTTIEAGSNPNDPIYIYDPNQDKMGYNNNLIILSYGNKLGKILAIPALSAIKDVNFGANLKFNLINLTGGQISEGNATGTELDVGLQGKPQPWLSLGGSVQNALPFSWGGKLHYDSGWEEYCPAILKLGTAVNILGREDSLGTLGDHSLRFLVDVDHEIYRWDDIPALLHIGIEWRPLEMIALRTGIDQEMTDIGQTVNNLTGGVGIYYGDFRFDYAYHQFDYAPGIDNHFFSLSYGIAPEPVVVKIPLTASPDKLITTQATIKVSGVVHDPKIKSVRVNGTGVNLLPKGEFQIDSPLNIGKNVIWVEGLSRDGKAVASVKLRILRLITYPDVAKDYWAWEQISYIGTLGIIMGYPDGNFKPEGNITRAESAALLARTKVGGEEKVPPTSIEVFKDVPLTHWAAKYVNLASDRGIVLGYPDNTFKPSANITRAEGLAMIARFGGVKEQPYQPNTFSDITAKHWVAPIMAGAYQEGMLIHFMGMPFEPRKKLTRAEAVELLYRSRPVIALIADLKDFDNY